MAFGLGLQFCTAASDDPITEEVTYYIDILICVAVRTTRVHISAAAAAAALLTSGWQIITAAAPCCCCLIASTGLYI